MQILESLNLYLYIWRILTFNNYTIMSFIANILITSLAVSFTAWLLPGIEVKNFGTAILVALVLAILDALVKPVMVFLTLPVTIVTLGLFLLVINTLIILLASWLVTNFHVNNFWWALLFSIIVSFVSSLLTNVFSKV